MPRRELSVPKKKQLPLHCGPASLSMVLAYYGLDIDQKELAERANLDPGDGVFPPNLIKCARELGFVAKGIHGLTIPRLRSIIDEGNPVIARVSYCRGYGHMLVVRGYDSDRGEVLIHEPEDLRFRKESVNKFKRIWKVDNYEEDRIWVTNNYGIVVKVKD